MAVVIDGKAAAGSVIEAVTSAATTLATSGHRKPGLAVVIVGNDPASHAYVGGYIPFSNATKTIMAMVSGGWNGPLFCAVEYAQTSHHRTDA